MIGMFILGLFSGTAVGIMLISALTAGKISDQNDEIDRLKYRLYGKEGRKK